MAEQICKICRGTSFSREYHTASGDLACVNCGSVLEENPIVSEVTFGENAAGAATVQGTYISNDRSHATLGGSLESREQTILNGRRRIKNVALALGIPSHVSDSAVQWYKLGLTNNFVQGRRSQNVVAACLYIACRKYNTHHMLIDFSSRLQVSVYAIGATFLKMVKALHITDLPLVDPSLFLQHFADKLDFGKKTNKVLEDAKKLAKRMSNDWIYEGRRPAGVAGACLLLAARMNNFRRTHLEIVAVTHISSQTIQKRLSEFKKTNASGLTIDEFRSDYEKVEPIMPPSYDKGKKEEAKLKEEIKKMETMEEDMLNDPVLGAMLEDSDVTEDEIQSLIRKIMKRKVSDLERKVSSISTYKEGMTSIELAANDEINVNSSYEGMNFAAMANQDPNVKGIRELELVKMIEKNKPRNLTKCLPTTEEILSRVPDDEEELEELINDDELDSFLLTKEESELKERLWIGLNKDFLLKQEQKRLKEETDKLAGHVKVTRKRKRKTDDFEEKKVDEMGTLAGLMRANMSGNTSASDNAKALLTSKTLSKKINYNAVNDLFND